jgi:hypothetical protein
MDKKQLRNELCRCGSGIKFKKCHGRISGQLYHEISDDVKQSKEKDTHHLYKYFKSFTPKEYAKQGWPNFKDLDFVKMVLEYWSSEKFKEVVFALEGKPVDQQRIEDKKNQLLNMSEGVKIQAELRYFVLHTPFYHVFVYSIPKAFYRDPKLIVSYELYSDPVSMELRTYGSQIEIYNSEQASKSTV